MEESIDMESCSDREVLARRVMGVIIDTLVIFPITLWIFFIGFKLEFFDLGLLPFLYGAGIFIGLLFFYTFLLEGAKGRTLGKMAMGIIVVGEDGNQCTYRASFLRNILRIFLDGLIFYLVALISILLSEKYQRVGDHAAKTIVVKME